MGSLHGVMVNVLDCSLEVCKFKLQSRYYVHIRSNTLGKSMKFIFPAMD